MYVVIAISSFEPKTFTQQSNMIIGLVTILWRLVAYAFCFALKNGDWKEAVTYVNNIENCANFGIPYKMALS